MSAVDRFDQRFTGLLEDLGAATYPDYFDDVLEVAMHRPQRPSWTFPERWLPMGVLAQRPAIVPSVPWRTIGLVALLALLAAALVVAIGSQRRVPPPFGPAANGVVAGARDGDIYARDTVDGSERLIIGGPDADVFPIFSRDGARLAFYRLTPNSADEATLFAGGADGSGLRALFGPAVFQSESWSPTSDRLAVISGTDARSLAILPVDGSQPDGPLDLGSVTPYTNVVWRPPNGEELVFKGLDHGEFGIYVVRVDGSEPPRRLIANADEGALDGPYEPSPDGRLLAYTEITDRVRVRILDLDTGVSRPFGESLPHTPNPGTGPAHWGGATFSPDGSKILFGRYWDEHDDKINHQLWIASPDGDGEDAIAIGPLHQSRAGHDPFWYTFSPDGKSVLIQGNEAAETWLAPVDRFDPQPLGWGRLNDPPNWQRVAP